jgi:hypothetical protein
MGVFMIRSCTAIILLSALIAVSHGSDWLEGGYVGSGSYGEVRQYFTDPIFNTRVPITSSSSYYPALDRKVFFKEPVALGKYTGKYTVGFPALYYQNPANISMSIYPSTAWQSEFRNKSLAAMQWESFQKNWTSTMNYASTRSSLRVKEGGSWRSI